MLRPLRVQTRRGARAASQAQLGEGEAAQPARETLGLAFWKEQDID